MPRPWFTSSLSTSTLWIQNTKWNDSGKTPFGKESESSEQDVTDLRIITWQQVWAGSSVPSFARCYGKMNGLFGSCFEKGYSPSKLGSQNGKQITCLLTLLPRSRREKQGGREMKVGVSLNLKFTLSASLAGYQAPRIHLSPTRPHPSTGLQTCATRPKWVMGLWTEVFLFAQSVLCHWAIPSSLMSRVHSVKVGTI